jgi:excisionase family DNA binding protein
MARKPWLSERRALSIPETCLALGISRALLLAEITRGKLRAVKVGARVLIPVRNLDAYLAEGEEPIYAKREMG